MVNLNRFHPVPQFRCLPSAGGHFNQEPLRYVLNVPGCSEEVNHSFVEWAVGESHRQLGLTKCASSTEGLKTSAALSSVSFAGSPKQTALSTCVTITNMASVSALSNGSSNISGRSL